MVEPQLIPMAHAQANQEVLESNSTSDKVETSIGTLEFFDGVPQRAFAETVYDYLDRMCGVDSSIESPLRTANKWTKR